MSRHHRDSLSFHPTQPESPSDATSNPNNNNTTTSTSSCYNNILENANSKIPLDSLCLLARAQRAAESFGCDLQRLLRSATPPKIQHAEVACSPGGHRSSRAMEAGIAKTRMALANALADVLLEALWQSGSQQREGHTPHRGAESPPPVPNNATEPFLGPPRHHQQQAHIAPQHRPQLFGDDDDDDGEIDDTRHPSIFGAQRSQQHNDAALQQNSGNTRRAPLLWAQKDSSNATIGLWLPPRQFGSSEPGDTAPPLPSPQRLRQSHDPPFLTSVSTATVSSTTHPTASAPVSHQWGQHLIDDLRARPQQPASAASVSVSALSGDALSLLLAGSISIGGGGHHISRSGTTATTSISDVAASLLPLLREALIAGDGGSHHRRLQRSFTTRGSETSSNDHNHHHHRLHSAFASASDLGAAFPASETPRNVTMATFLKNMDVTAAVSATTGGAVPLCSEVPIEFTATHKAKHARATDSNRWILNGRYEFVGRLGSGGQGSVWRVRDLTTGAFLAIKIVPRGKMRRNCLSIAARSSAAIGLLAGDLSVDDATFAEADGDNVPHCDNAIAQPHTAIYRNESVYTGIDDDNNNNDGTAPPSPQQPSSLRSGNRGSNTNTENVATNAGATCWDPSTTASGLLLAPQRSGSEVLRQSTSLLDGSALLSQSADVLRLFYEDHENDGGTLPEGLAMEIVMGLFRHPHTVPLYEVIDDPSCNNVFLVMPLAKPLPFSLNLASGHLTTKGPSADTILSYAKAAASALAVFHAAGIVHCDIKLDNLLLLPGMGSEDNDVLAIADFGVCQLSAKQQPGALVNVLGGGSGTLAYWAPECFAAKKQSDTFTAASDCYALGLCIYAMAFGRFPYWTSDVMNPLSWEKVIPGTARYEGPLAASHVPSPVGSDPHTTTTTTTILTEIIHGLLSPAASERMSAPRVVELLTHL